MVELIRSYWMEQAKLAEERKEKAGAFVGFVLLSEDEWDKEQLIRDLKEEWDIDAAEDDDEAGDDSLAFNVGDMIAVASIMHCPVPTAKRKRTRRQLHVARGCKRREGAQSPNHSSGAGQGGESRRARRTLRQACCLLLPPEARDRHLHERRTVFEPSFFYKFADMMKGGEFPIFNLIWFGLYPQRARRLRLHIRNGVLRQGRDGGARRRCRTVGRSELPFEHGGLCHRVTT